MRLLRSLGLGLALAVTAWPSSGQEKLTACVNLVASPSPAAYGGQTLNAGSAPKKITISNVPGGFCGETAFSITVAATAGFSVTRNTCGTLSPRQACEVDVVFTPAAEGVLGGTLTVSYQLVRVFVFSGSIQVPLTGTGERTLTSHYYAAILKRGYDIDGKTFWDAEAARVASMGANVNEAWRAMAQAFFFSAEYALLNRDNTGFVTDLYLTFFNRAPDPDGLAFWVSNLAQGMPREVALASFVFSPEFRAFTGSMFGNTAVRAEIDMVTDFYRGLLGRLPDSSGFAPWVAQFRAAQCQGADAVLATVEAISQAFLQSAEYIGRNRTDAQYVGDLYNAFLRRGGDLGGVLFWIGALTRTAPAPLGRDQLRQAFKNSPEFQARVSAIVAQGCAT